MVKVVFEYDVVAEKQEEYLRVTKENIKPFWENNGCLSYDVWQVSESQTRFIKEMLFDDLPALKTTLALQEAEPAKDLFRQFAQNVSRKICFQRA